MDFTVSQNVLEFVLQDANFFLKKLAFAFLTACVYWFPERFEDKRGRRVVAYPYHLGAVSQEV
jgi:hypothetical protein